MAFKEIQLSDIEHIEFYVPTSRMSITSAYNTHLWNGRKCNSICNGSLFDMQSKANSTITYGASNGKQIGYLFSKEGYIFNDNEVRFGTLDEALRLQCDFIGSAPLLSKGGKYVCDWGNRAASPSVTGKHIRTGIGLSKDKIVLYTSDDEITLETLNSRLKAKGCTEICNYDGGGSTSMMIDGKYSRNTSRLLANFIMIWLKQSKPVIDKKEDDEVKKSQNIVIQDGSKKSTVKTEVIVNDNTTYIPFRQFAELIGYKVEYNSKTGEITIKR